MNAVSAITLPAFSRNCRRCIITVSLRDERVYHAPFLPIERASPVWQARAMLRIEPLSPALGVEISGVDLAEPLDDQAFARIRSAWENNCIALFRGQRIDEAAQMRFASRFGELGGIVNDFDPLKRGSHP